MDREREYMELGKIPREWFLIIAPVSLAIFLLSLLLEPYLGYRTLGVIWILAIAISGLFFDKALLLLIFAVLVGGLYVVVHYPSFESWGESDLEYFAYLFAFYGVAITCGFMIQRLRLQAVSLSRQEASTRMLYSLVKEVATTESVATLIESASKKLLQLSHIQTALYLSSSDPFTPRFLRQPESTFHPEAELVSQAIHLFEDPSCTEQLVPLTPSIYIFTFRRSNVLSGFFLFKPGEILPELTWLKAAATQIILGIEREILRESNQAIALMERTQSLYKSLLNSVSHELKTPLGTITGAASAMLASDTEKNAGNVRLFSQEILVASQRLTSVVDKLLDLSRIDAGMLQLRTLSCDIRDLLAVAVERLNQEGKKNRVLIRCHCENPLLAADPNLIEQAFYNILQNASIYGPPDGEIHIDIEEDSERRMSVRFRDFGPGIPDTHQKKIFERFYRGDPKKTGGLGLGLSIVSGFIEAHGGSIWASNHPSGGAIFTTLFPGGKSL